MKYEIVRLPEKTVSGLAVRTNNFSPDMGQAIGGVWKRFYEERAYQEIPNKKREPLLAFILTMLRTKGETILFWPPAR